MSQNQQIELLHSWNCRYNKDSIKFTSKFLEICVDLISNHILLPNGYSHFLVNNTQELTFKIE